MNIRDYDFTDSIIYEMKFTKILTEFMIKIDYYFAEDKNNTDVVICFKNCYKVDYLIFQKIYELNNKELNWSHFTITKMEIVNAEKMSTVIFYTTSDSQPFLTIDCENIQIESRITN